MSLIAFARRLTVGLVFLALIVGALAGTRGASAVNPPVPQDDHYTVAAGGVLNVQKPGVLANDISGSGSFLQVTDLGATNGGTVSLNGNGSFSFTTKAGFVGTAFFQYKIDDGANTSLRFGTAFIKVVAGGPSNAAPVAKDNAFNVKKNGKLGISKPGVLGNDTDANKDVLRANLVSKPAKGTLVLKSDGGFVYTPNKNFVGTDKFTYRANDGAANSNIATVTFTVK
jgi:hypothetical protein